MGENEEAVAQFWAEVVQNPSEFVLKSRLPENVVFGDPTMMTMGNFIQLYRHVHRSQDLKARHALAPEQRWEYSQVAINRQQNVQRALRVQKEQEKKGKRKAKKDAQTCVLLYLGDSR